MQLCRGKKHPKDCARRQSTRGQGRKGTPIKVLLVIIYNIIPRGVQKVPTKTLVPHSYGYWKNRHHDMTLPIKTQTYQYDTYSPPPSLLVSNDPFTKAFLARLPPVRNSIALRFGNPTTLYPYGAVAHIPALPRRPAQCPIVRTAQCRARHIIIRSTHTRPVHAIAVPICIITSPSPPI